MVAWADAVTEGNEPITAFRKFRLFLIKARMVGQAVGHWLSAFHPPPSMTNVTMTLGRVVRVGSPGRGWPSLALKSKPISDAAEGARSARETRSRRSSGRAAIPAAYRTRGTLSVYTHPML